MVNNIFALYSINSTIRGFTDSNQVSMKSEQEIFANYRYNFAEFPNLRENFDNIDRLILSAGKIENDEGFEYKLREDDETELIDKFINDNNPEKIRYSLVSDIDYSKEYYEFRDNSFTVGKLLKGGFYQDFASSLINANKKKGHSGVVLEFRESTIKESGYNKFAEFSGFLRSKLSEQNQELFLKIDISEKEDDFKEVVDQFENIIVTADSKDLDFQDRGKLNISIEKIKNIISLIGNKEYFLEFPSESIQYSFYDDGFYQTPLSYENVGELIIENSLDIESQKNSIASFIRFEDENGVENKIYIRDSISIYNLMVSLSNLDLKNLQGYGVGNVGFEDPQIWNILLEPSLEKNKEELEDFWFTDSVEVNGKGDIPLPVEDRVIGERKLNFLGDYISSQEITSFPQQSVVELTGNGKNKIAITFDDGPHPDYTPPILDILKEENVKGVFFVTGINVLKYPEVAQRIVDEGHEIANHTYTHPRTYSMSDETFKNELIATTNIIQEVTGVTPKLFRIPFSDTIETETEHDLRRYRIADELGLKIAGYDLNSQDWILNDKDKILEEVFSQDFKNSNQLLLHDGGFQRKSTVDSLQPIIKGLKNEGVDIVRVDELESGTANILSATKSNSQNLFKRIGFVFQSALSTFLTLYLFLFLIFSILRFIFLWFMNAFSVFDKTSSRFSALKENSLVSIVIACYNEEKIIKKTIESALMSSYDNIEIIVVNDGSTDKSLSILKENFQGNKKVRILSIPNGGKANAINHALGFCKGEYIFSIDADTIVLPETLQNLLQGMTPNVGAIAGNIQVGNDNNLLTKNQRLEYISAQNFDKIGYQVLNTIMVVPGALGLWRKKAIFEAGFYHTDTLAEDADLTIRIIKKGWKVKYDSKAIALTEAPETISSFIKQRVRWSYGTLQTAFKHRDMLFNRKYGWFGFVIIPEIILSNIFLLVTAVNNLFLLTLFVKIVSTFIGADIYIGSFFESADVYAILFYLVLFLSLYLLTVLLAMVRDKSKNKWYLLLYIPFNIYLYRQLIWVISFWVLVKAIKGKRAFWNHFEKRGNMLVKIENPAT